MAVRRESVVLSLDDRFSSGMAIAAARTEMLRRELDRLDGSGVKGARGIDRTTTSADKLSTSTQRGGREIDKFSGRLRVLADVAALVGPSLIPIGAVAVPALTGLAAQFGFAAIGAGTMITAFQGVGDALKAVNKAGLEPTEANLEAARLAMSQIGPDARAFVKELRSMQPALQALRDSAAAGLFPGLTEGLDELSSRLPEVERIIENVSEALGQIGADTGASLASGRWDSFFEFLATDAPAALASMARAAGNTAHAMAEMWMAFDPLNDSFSLWLENATASLDRWASGLSKTEGFQDFIDYIRQTGPQVAETFGAIGNAVVQIVQAAAPLGGPVLHALELIADAIASIAGSDAGPTIMASVTAMALLSRGMATFDAVSRTSWASGIRGAETFSGKVAAARVPLLKGGAAAAGLALASSDAAKGFGLSNTASMALIGTLGGPWGAAVGGAIGLMMDLGGSGHEAAVNAESLTATLNQQTGAITANTRAYTAGELEKQGVLKAAQALGLSLADVTEAALGNSTAMASVNAGLDAAKQGFYDVEGRTIVGADVLQKYRDNMGLVKTAVGETSGALRTGQERIARIGDAAGTASGGMDKFAAANARARAQLLAQRQAAGTVARQFVNLGDSLDDAKVSLNGWIRQLARQADALTNFANNAQRAANKGLRQGLIKALQEAGPAGAMRMRQLANATQKEIAKANAAWGKGQRAIEKYKDAVGGVPPKKVTRIDTVGAAEARNAADAVKNALNNIPRTVRSTIRVTRSGAIGGPGAATASADGSTVPKTGRPYADRHLYLLADGEEVISNRFGQADRHRGLLKQINAGHLAEGGTAGDYARKRRGNGDGGASPALKRLREELEKTTKTLGKERTARDALISKRNDLRSTVSGAFTSDIFGGSDVWAAGAGDPRAMLKADIAKANAFKSSLYALKQKGLDGQALAAIASTGDVGKAQALLGLGKSGLADYESLYKQRASAAAAAGKYAGSAVYGSAIAADNRQIKALVDEVKDLRHDINHHNRGGKKRGKDNARETGREVGRAVSHAGAAGRRKSRRG